MNQAQSQKQGKQEAFTKAKSHQKEERTANKTRTEKDKHSAGKKNYRATVSQHQQALHRGKETDTKDEAYSWEQCDFTNNYNTNNTQRTMTTTVRPKTAESSTKTEMSKQLHN